MKECSICKEKKDYSEFNKRSTSKDGFQNLCRVCSNNKSRKNYSANKDVMKKQISKNKEKYKIELQKFIFDYLSNHPCVHCNETDPVVLEFDHLRDKETNVSTAIKNIWSIARIKTEISKCQILCANCHRRKTAKDQKWFTYVLSESSR